MLNIANANESLSTYIKKELRVEDFFELLSLVTENIYQGMMNQQVLQLNPKTVWIKNGNLILQREDRSGSMNVAAVRYFCKEIVFETIFEEHENCTKITNFLKFLDDENGCRSVMDIQNYCDEASGPYTQSYQSLPASEQMAFMPDMPSGDETGVLDPVYLQKALSSNVSAQLSRLPDIKTVQLVNTKSGSVSKINKEVFWIGKGADCDLRILDETVSRKHASIIVKNNHYFLCDNDSTNKTFVDNREIPAKASVEIFDGAKLKFSNIEFDFRIEY